MAATIDLKLLLQEVHRGDESALDRLLAAHLEWIRGVVRKRMGAALRWKAETDDMVQLAVIEFLRYGPCVVMSDENAFRGLMVRIVENVLRGEHDRFNAQRRDQAPERGVPRDSVLDLDPPTRSVSSPSQVAQRNETRDWVRLALEILDPAEHEIIRWREWDGLAFETIAERLGVAPDAARMRFNRALSGLATTVAKLRAGRVIDLL